MIGRHAVEAAVEGKTGVMISVVRDYSKDYAISISEADISKIANEVKKVPDAYINASGDGVTVECIKYLAPLIMGEVDVKYENGLPKHMII